MENEMIDVVTPKTEREARREMRKSFNRIGFSIFVTILVWLLLSVALQSVAMILDNFGFAGTAFLEQYLLLLNEVTLAIGLVAGILPLIGAVKEKPEKQKFSFGRLVIALLVCAGMGFAGNLAGSIFLAVWRLVTRIPVENAVIETVASSGMPMMILCAVVLAPILEELIFRKFIIDRTYRYGEKTAILTSAIFFGLFHMNFSQLFYAFGLGLVLAYIYCRSGKIWLTMLTHMIFNLVFGVLSVWISEKTAPALEAFYDVQHGALSLAQFVSEHGLALVLYLLYALIIFGVEIAGFVMIFVRGRRFRARPGSVVLSGESRARAILLNAGILLCGLTLLALTGLSLFQIG